MGLTSIGNGGKKQIKEYIRIFTTSTSNAAAKIKFEYYKNGTLTDSREVVHSAAMAGWTTFHFLQYYYNQSRTYWQLRQVGTVRQVNASTVSFSGFGSMEWGFNRSISYYFTNCDLSDFTLENIKEEFDKIL